MLRETEAKLTNAELATARAAEAAQQAEQAKELISEKFEQHVSDAEENIQLLREELTSCTVRLWGSLRAGLLTRARAARHAHALTVAVALCRASSGRR